METLVSCLLVFVAGLLAVPVTIFFSETVAALVLPHPNRARPGGQRIRRRVAVLVPAHDEGDGLLPTLADIKMQLRPGDRLLVVADNCSDDTATVAATAGAEVIERHDLARFGKGYALDFGVRHLAVDPPDIVVVIDADCRLGEETIDRLVTTCAMTGRPAQALDLMTASAEDSGYRVAEFAWRVKNWLRPLGLSALGLPCQLAGTGMALPWHVISRADLASAWIVEDLRLGLELALVGHPPLFCTAARVTSAFPTSSTGTDSQRKRWEQGHIHTILKLAPRLLCLSIARRNGALLALTLDLAVPPLSLLAMFLAVTFVAAALAALLGMSSAALLISAGSLLAFVLAIFLAWLNCGRDVLPARAIWAIAPYVLAKLPLYRHILANKADDRWIRTDRTKSG
jgi:cellulose synthase/poly-beta-1,6-N-acetylglucosamine synthase-like glycosyltransferase